MKVAIFRKIMGANWHLDLIIQEKDAVPDSIYIREYTQLTEWADVDFTFRPPESVVEGQLKQLDRAEQELCKQFEAKQQELAEARSKLLTLTCETSP